MCVSSSGKKEANRTAFAGSQRETRKEQPGSATFQVALAGILPASGRSGDLSFRKAFRQDAEMSEVRAGLP
jgi:hypothetical protein